MSSRYRFAFCLVLLFAATRVWAAPLSFVPQVVTQPDGTTVHCFASGDEYYNWLHDERGFTIVRDPASSRYVYAVKEGERLMPSALVAGRDDPARAGLEPWLNVSPAQKKSARDRRLAMTAATGARVQSPAAGTINNIVIFIRFAGEPEFTDVLTTYANMFNGSTAGTSSMYNYFQEASYGELSVVSSFYPNPLGGKIKSYQDSHTRAYYSPYDASKNPDGYKSDGESYLRESTLLNLAVNHVAPQIPTSLVIDSNGDQYVDNVCFVVSGTPTAWSTLLWPHMSWLGVQTRINNKIVRAYNLQIRSALLGDGASVLSHEMGHTLGAPDLYHYTSSAVTPVGSWDLMAANTNPPQHMGAYMKYKYLGWVRSIPFISTPGRYSLKPLTSATGNCYAVRSPYSTSQFFVLEYRKKTTMFENRLPGEGLLVYRIDGSETGNADGPPDEIYVYRPNGTGSVNGTLNRAALCTESGFTALDDRTNPRVFLASGSPGGLRIRDVSSCGDSIQFTLEWPMTAVLDSALVTAHGSDSVLVEWTAEAQCRSKGFEVQRASADSDQAFQTIPGSSIPGDGTVGENRSFSFVDRSNSGELYYRLKIIDTDDSVSYSRSSRLNTTTAIAGNASLPLKFALEQNYPNPFNPRTVISSQLPVASHVKLAVYDLLGREVAVLVDQWRPAGSYRDAFSAIGRSGSGGDGSGLASGAYICRLSAGPFVASRTMLLLK